MIATPTSVIPLKITVRPANLLLSFTGAFLCCAVTAALVNFAGWHSVPASSGTALLAVMAGLLFRLPDSFVLAAYCGTFAGGGVVTVEQDHLFWLSALSLIVASVAVAVQCLQSRWPAIGLVGIGGRLGVFAFIGFSIFAVLFRSSVTIGDVGSLKTSALTVSVLGVIVGATTTTEIRRFLVIDTAYYNVLASAVVGVAASVFLVSGDEFGRTLATALFAGSFIGMSTLADLRAKFILLSSLIASVVVAAAGILLPGWGGLLGSAAACSVIAAHGLEPGARRTGRATR